jgi:predicted Fe-S protein YdhL (DUF1289 family)
MTPTSAPEQDDINVYPCIGICIVDDSGHCIGCGRPADVVSDSIHEEPATEAKDER